MKQTAPYSNTDPLFETWLKKVLQLKTEQVVLHNHIY